MTVRQYIESGLLSLDIEFGNAFGFCSGTRHLQWNSNAMPATTEKQADIRNASLHVKDNLLVSEESLARQTTFKTNTDSHLFDIVVRYVVYSCNDRCARINNRDIWHRSRNIYHQFPAGEIAVPIGTTDWVLFSPKRLTVPEGFSHVCYIRDEVEDKNGYRWIVHDRMIASSENAVLTLKGCHPLYDKPIFLENLVPDHFKMKLVRIRETTFPDFPVMTIPEHCVPQNTTVSFFNQLTVSDNIWRPRQLPH